MDHKNSQRGFTKIMLKTLNRGNELTGCGCSCLLENSRVSYCDYFQQTQTSFWDYDIV